MLPPAGSWAYSIDLRMKSRSAVQALVHVVETRGDVTGGDNAAMESLFALLQEKDLDRRSWTTREQLRIAIVIWFERTQHRVRRHPGWAV